MKIHHLAADEVLRSLQSGPGGLSAEEARRRLSEFGLNQVERARRKPLVLRFLAEFTHFFALILWLAAGLAFYAAWNDPTQGMGMLGCAILAVILINGVFSFGQVYRAEKALEALERLLPHKAQTLRDGAYVDLPTAELVPGDIISVQAGDLVSADCRLIEAYDVRVNNATVTGEATSRTRNAAPSVEENVLQSDNILLAGTIVVSGDAKAVVYATGMSTEFGKIAHLTQATREGSFPLQREIAFLSRVVAVLSTGLGVVFFLIGLTIPLSFWQNFLFAIGIIVANVPEGLLPTVTLALAFGAQRMARCHVLVRHLPAVETLGSATVICTDKTGTLTENRMTVERLFLGESSYDVSGGAAVLERLVEAHRGFFESATHCENIKTSNHAGRLELLGDPTEVALVELASRVLPDRPQFPRVDEIPFDSDRKRLSTLHETPAGLVLFSKGALESLLPLATQVRTENGIAPLTADWRQRFLLAQERMAEDGLRVMAIAQRRVADNWDHATLERDLILEGLAGLEDPPRPNVPAAIRTCREAGIKVVMLTGDHPQTAVAIARQIGLVGSATPVVITGDRLHKMSNSELQLVLDHPEVIFARMAADQKLRIVSTLQRKGEIVAVTGDGVNDAPALKQADIGIAMGVTGTDVARETADLVLTDDNFASIVAAIEEGRAVFDNVRKFLTYILTSNIPEVVPYLAFVLLRIPLPLTIIQILAVDLGTDMVPALGLGAEPPASDIMRRPPRPRSERLLTWPLLSRAYLFLGLLEAVAAMAAYFFVLWSAGWTYGEEIPAGHPFQTAYLEATTACLAAIVAMQVVNVFLCRSDRRPFSEFPLFGNRLIILGIVVELLLLAGIVYTWIGNQIFGTVPLPWQVWLFVAPFPLVMVALEEFRKWLVRRKARI